jgi:hypothetical protein
LRSRRCLLRLTPCAKERSYPQSHQHGKFRGFLSRFDAAAIDGSGMMAERTRLFADDPAQTLSDILRIDACRIRAARRGTNEQVPPSG